MFTNHWGSEFEVESHDIINGKDVFDLPDDYGKNYDFVLCAPPCTQFTKVNNHNWLLYPFEDIEIVRKCLRICLFSHKPFILENPPGRLTRLVPELEYIKLFNLNDITTNKEWILYGNVKIPFSPGVRYGRKTINNLTRKNRLAYPPFFIEKMKEVFYANVKI
jgi:site-specific DNA-cytosine methylase